MQPYKLAVLTLMLFVAGAVVFAQGPRKDAGSNVPLGPSSSTSKTGTANASLSVDVDLVPLDVVVVDKKGTLIKGLDKKDFKVFDDNVEQTITAFTPTDAPLTVVVLLEFSQTFGYYYDNVIPPAAGFIQSLGDDDWVALEIFDLHPQIISDFTKDKNQLFAGLKSLKFAMHNELAFFDALYDTLERLDSIDGKKAIFLLGTGLDSISQHTYGEALKKAQTSDTMIYSISLGQLARTVLANQITPELNIQFLAGDNQLRSVSEATGGQAFYPRYTSEYPDIYDNVGKQLRNQYSMGFVPTNRKKDGKLHKLRVEVADLDLNKDGKPDGLKARSKQGYYAPKS